MPATRESIDLTLGKLNAAENSPSMSAEEKSAVVDGLCADDVRGWANGLDRGGRDAERETESFLWTTFPNYHRQFEEVLIDPPRAAVRWRMTGSSEAPEMELSLSGATVFHFDEDSKIKEFWLYYHDPLA